MLTATLPTAERWQNRAPLRVIAERLQCSYDHLWRMFKSGLLACIHTANGLETTEAEVIAAWAKRAEAGREAAVETPNGRPKKPSREERARRAADALGVKIQGQD